MQERFRRRSDLRPIRIMGVVGQKCTTSGYHFLELDLIESASLKTLLTLSMTFSRELGQSMAKQTKRRSVSGYESGRRRSYSSWPAVSHRASSTV